MLGPMTNSLEGVRAFTKAIIDAKPWRKDPLCVRKEWSEREYALGDHGGQGARLCFAIMWDNGILKPHPPLRRAMEMTKRALEAAGHTGMITTPMLCARHCIGYLTDVLPRAVRRVMQSSTGKITVTSRFMLTASVMNLLYPLCDHFNMWTDVLACGALNRRRSSPQTTHLICSRTVRSPASRSFRR